LFGNAQNITCHKPVGVPKIIPASPVEAFRRGASSFSPNQIAKLCWSIEPSPAMRNFIPILCDKPCSDAPFQSLGCGIYSMHSHGRPKTQEQSDVFPSCANVEFLPIRAVVGNLLPDILLSRRGHQANQLCCHSPLVCLRILVSKFLRQHF